MGPADGATIQARRTLESSPAQTEACIYDLQHIPMGFWGWNILGLVSNPNPEKDLDLCRSGHIFWRFLEPSRRLRTKHPKIIEQENWLDLSKTRVKSSVKPGLFGIRTSQLMVVGIGLPFRDGQKIGGTWSPASGLDAWTLERFGLIAWEILSLFT